MRAQKQVFLSSLRASSSTVDHVKVALAGGAEHNEAKENSKEKEEDRAVKDQKKEEDVMPNIKVFSGEFGSGNGTLCGR